MPTTLVLTPTESVRVRRADADAVEVEVTYGPGAKPPPRHLHPGQHERFEVLAGTVHAWVDGRRHVLAPGDALDVPRGAVHQLWNEGDEPARAIWETSPAGRTLEWFEALDALAREGKVGKNHMPGPRTLAVLLTEYRDVLQIAARPRALVRGALALLALGGRRRLPRVAVP